MRERNVVDFFAYWTTEAIKAELDTKRHNFSILVTNQIRDFNLGAVVRNANAFLAKEVIIYGRKSYDRRGTVGAHLYENLKFIKHIEELEFGDAMVIGVDNLAHAEPIDVFPWNTERHTILAFGEEVGGLPEEVQKICERFVYIRQFGSVRSLNVGCASAIAMYEYTRANLHKSDSA